MEDQISVLLASLLYLYYGRGFVRTEDRYRASQVQLGSLCPIRSENRALKCAAEEQREASPSMFWAHEKT